MSAAIPSAKELPEQLEPLIQQLSAMENFLPGFIYQLLCYPDGQFRYSYVSQNVEQLFLVTAQQALADANHLLALIHPDDFERVIHESMACAEQQCQWHSEFRMNLADGQTLWIECYDTPMQLADGCIVWTGYANDISERKALQQRYQASEARFRTFVENANDIIYNLSRDGVLIYVSPNWSEMLGQPVAEVLGKPLNAFVHPDDISHCDAFFMRVQGTGKKQSGIEYRLQHQNGDWSWYRSNASPLLDADGKVESLLGIARDITGDKQLLAHMQHMAHHDALTGLANRSLFADHLHQACLLAQRQQRQLAVLFLDLDKFKPVNDVHGHAIGDLLLQQVAIRIKNQLRNSDTIGRIGGDEFVVLLHDIEGYDTAYQVASKIRHSIGGVFHIQDLQLHITVSIGIACYPEHGQQPLQLVRAADEAMYIAKAGTGISLFQANPGSG